MAKRTKRRNTRRRVSKNTKTRKRKTRRIRRKMRGGESWICPGCGVKTNNDPCQIVTHREKYTVMVKGKPVERDRDVICNTPKPKLIDV